jgi:hypothetical protein
MNNDPNQPNVTDDEVAKLDAALAPSAKPEPADDDGQRTEPELDERTGRVDEELDAAASDEDREAIRARRREERHNRKNRQREKTGGLEREVASLREQLSQQSEQLAALQDTSTESQIAQLRQVETQVGGAMNAFRQEHAAAVERGDGTAATAAMEKLMQAQGYAARIGNDLRTITHRAKNPPPAQLDQDMVRNATEFMSRNKWFKGATAPDPDSKVLAALDNSLTAEGWDPKTDAYWQELEVRAARYLPHRFQAAPGESSYTKGLGTRASPVAGASNVSGGGGKSSTSYTISAERVSAMKAAGIWDDAPRRAAMIKRYQQQDSDNR